MKPGAPAIQYFPNVLGVWGSHAMFQIDYKHVFTVSIL